MTLGRLRRGLGALGLPLALVLSVTAPAGAGTDVTPKADAYRDQPPLAYVSHGHVFVLDGKGNPPRQVRGTSAACCVAFSPDGYYVAFQQRGDLWVVEHDGTDLHRVAPSVSRWAWAPDGQALAVIPKPGPDGAGTGIDFYGAENPKIRQTMLPGHRVLDLSWAGLGRRLAVSAVPPAATDDADARAQVFMLEVPGPYGDDCPALCPEAPIRIPVEHPDATSGPLFASWSPHADAIAVWTTPENGATLGVVSPAGGSIVPLASTLVRRSWVQWAGDRLLVIQGDAREAGGRRDLLLCTRTGDCNSITGNDESVADLAWSRGGTLAYVWSGRRELWVAHDGADSRRLMNAGEGVSSPRWLPDTRSLVFVRDGLVWLLDTSTGDEEAVPVAGPLSSGSDRPTPIHDTTDQSSGVRWEQLYSVAP
jgi:dipeptidyl aminopeptidase/acylaminoacyl peptidase